MSYSFRYKPVIYACIKTSEPFTNNEVIKKWLFESIVYQNVIRYCRSCYFAEDFEKDFSRESFDEHACIYIDILSGHSAKRRQGPARPKLRKILDSNNISAIHVYDYSMLGESVDEILAVYKECKEKLINITCVNYAMPNDSEPFSTGTGWGDFDLSMYKHAVKFIKDNGISNNRGHIQKDLSRNFIHALLLYENYMISENAAIALSGLSANTFHNKSYDIETHPKDFALNFFFRDESNPKSSYEEIVKKWLEYYGTNPNLGFNITDYKDSPKRYGNIPMTKEENANFEDAKKEAAFSKQQFKKGLSNKIIKMPDQNEFCETFRRLDDINSEIIDNEELYKKLIELKLPLITAIDLIRYQKKLHLMDTKKRFRVNTTESPVEHAVYEYLEAIPVDRRESIDFMDWYLKK